MGFSAIDQLTRPLLQLHEWDNGAERIVHTTTIQILLCFGLLLSSNLMFGQPITCLMLPETPDSSTNYFHDFCFYQDKLRVTNTTVRSQNRGYVHVNSIATKDEIAVTYYQWTPFIIFLQVALCLLPAMMWKFFGLHFFHGNDFAAIIRGFVSQEEDDKMDGNCADLKISSMQTHRWLELKKRDRSGMYTTMMIYVAMKWVTFLSLLLQFCMMAEIYADGRLLWGVHISYDLLNGVYKNVFTGVFPQIVGCRTHRTQLGGVINEFVMRCILPQNFINSKVFLFLYWWYVLAMLVSIFSAVQFTAMLLLPRYQRYATKALLPTQEFFLEEAGREQHNVIAGDSDPLEYFVDYLGNDGYLLLQCSSVPLSVVRHRFFVNALYEVIVVQGGMHEKWPEKPKKPDPSKEKAIRNLFEKEKKSKRRMPMGPDVEGGCDPLLIPVDYQPSCSSQEDRYSEAPGKCYPPV